MALEELFVMIESGDSKKSPTARGKPFFIRMIAGENTNKLRLNMWNGRSAAPRNWVCDSKQLRPKSRA